jgi:hypothetical protein
MTDIKIIERKEEMTMTKDLCAALKSKADDYKLYGGYSEIDSGTEQENDRLRPIIDALIEVIEMQDAGLETSGRHCLCVRNTWGFDYCESHKILGKPGPGKRWLTPNDVLKETRATAHAMLEGILK